MENPELQLARAVIHRALEDVFRKDMTLKDDKDAEEAMSFLTEENGNWKASRMLWCRLADVDPEALSMEVGRRLRGGEINTRRRGDAGHNGGKK